MERVGEAQAVTESLHEYVEGVRLGDIRRVRAIFHPEAIMSGNMNGMPVMGAPTPFFNDVEHGPSQDSLSQGYAAQVLSVDVVGITATAILAEDRISVGQPDGSRILMNIVDRFHLLKVDEKWLIVSKQFYHDPV